MSNRTLTADIIAKEALAIMDNELGWLGRIHRAYEDEFAHKVNGYKVGDTISIRRPADFTVRSGAVVNLQDVIEGKITLTVDQIAGVDFQFSGSDLELKIDDLSERAIKPAVIRLVNYIANDVLTTAYPSFNNWVGTAGNTIDSFADFYKGPERLNIGAVPMEDRIAVLSPQDHAGMLGSQTGLYMTGPATDAYRRAELGNIGGVDVFMSQLVPVHTAGSRTNTTPITSGTALNVTYDSVKDVMTQSLPTINGETAGTYVAGDVFTLGSASAGIQSVNPQTKVATGVLQQFAVTTNVTAVAGAATLTISPPIILSGPHQNCKLVGVSNTDALAVTNVGTASTSYRQNLVMHKNAIALAMVPLEMPAGTVGGSRKSHKGLSVRVMPGWDFVNNTSAWRLDVLYARKCIDPRLGVRLSGT